MAMSPDQLRALRERFDEMRLVELLEYAYSALEHAPSGVSDGLTRLRWEKFGRLADRIAKASRRARLPAIDEIEQLRDFCFNEELARQAMDGAESLLHLLLSPRSLIRAVWGRAPWN